MSSSLGLVEVLVLSMSPTTDRSALKVTGVRLGDLANRPYTFLLKPDDAASIMADLKLKYESGSEKDVIIEINKKFLIPVIRSTREAIEPTPFTSAT